MELARREHSGEGGGGGRGHNTKTLSDVSRKAHINVLSLARARPLSARCNVRTSGFQAALVRVEDSPSPKSLSGQAGLEGQGARSARPGNRVQRELLKR